MIRSVSAVSALATALDRLLRPAAHAHTGWAWTASGFLQLEGTITDLQIGSRTAALDVDVAGAHWRVDLSPLPEAIHSGLLRGAVDIADDVIAIGDLAAANRLTAVRVVVNGTVYDLDPERARAIFPLAPSASRPTDYDLVTDVGESSA